MLGAQHLMTTSSIIYGDVPAETAAYDSAKVVILPCPYEHTTSYGKGTADGPTAIIRASGNMELFDEELWAEPYAVGIHTAAPVEFGNKRGEAAIHEIAARVEQLYKDKKMPCILGGEHSISTGSIMAAHKFYPNLTVVQVDAHGDLRQEFHDTPWSHASIMRRVVEMGIPTVGVGIRSICEEEAVLIREKQLPRIFAHEIDAQGEWITRALSHIKGPVFLTYDVDGIDPSLIPATGTPEPGGLSWQQSNAFLKALFSSKQVVGMDFVELAPIADSVSSDFVVAKLVYKAIGYWARSQKLI